MTDTTTPSAAEIDAFIRQWVAEQELLSAPVDATRTLDQLGFDSLAIVDLVGAVKRKLGVKVQPHDLYPDATLDATIARICTIGGAS